MGHGIAALASWAAARPLSRRSLASPWFGLALLASVAPDLDFLPGLLLGNEAIFHRGASHSLGGGAAFGALVLAAVLAFGGSRGTAVRATLLAAGLYGGHLLLDLAGYDPGPPLGIQLLWPFSAEYFISPVALFPHLDRHPFDTTVFARAVPVVAVEAAVLGPLLAAAVLARRLRRRDVS